MKEAILLVYMGAPSSLEEVQPFLYRLFSDRDLINFGAPAFLHKPLAYLISLFRAPKVKPHYEAIGGGSPLLKYTKEQAKLIEERMGIKTFVGMTYSEPLLEKVAREIEIYHPDNLYVLTLYPQYSAATAGACLMAVEKLLGKKIKCRAVKSWCINPFYIRWIQTLIKEELHGLEEPLILFSAHSLPEYFVKNGDVYVKEVKDTVSSVMEEFSGIPYRICYQSKVGPIEWLKPSTESILKQLSKEGRKEVVVFPLSFVSEHIETLYELDIQYGKLAEQLGLEYRRVKLNHRHLLLLNAIVSEIDKLRKQQTV